MAHRLQVQGFTHSEECNTDLRLFNEWLERHPDACTVCYGQGYSYYAGSHMEPPSNDPCVCIEKGQCPRCESLINFVETDYITHCICPSCGWDDSLFCEHELTQEQVAQRNEMYAPDFDCYCWLNEVN